MAEFLLPDLGEGLTEATVLRWMVKVGDVVVIDQPVVEVETAKAAVEVPIPFAGVVEALHAEEGAVALVGKPLIRVVSQDAELTPPTAAPEGAAQSQPVGGSGNVLIGYGTPEEGSRRRRRRGAPAASEPVKVDDVSLTPVRVPVAANGAPLHCDAAQLRGVISPVVRRLARDAGIDLQTLTPSTGDVLCRADVELAIAARHQNVLAPTENAPNAESAGIAANSAPLADESGVRRIPLSGARAFAAEKFSRSRSEIPEATVWVDVDATEFVALRRRLSTDEQPVSLLSLFARFVVGGLRRFPQLNARIEDGVILQHEKINLGFAAQTPKGLMVPVVYGADAMSLRQIATAVGERITQGRDGELGAAQMGGGTFTINNYGGYGVDGSAAIINHPEVAILGIGRIIDRPWVVDGELVVRKVAQLTIAFDHRACDGDVPGGFLRFVADCIERPERALLDL